MNIENQINESIKDSMKNKDSLRLESLRSIKSAILLEKTKFSSKKNLDENEITKILQRLVKQRNDSAKIYNEQKREDLANIEIAQLKIISEFLPEQLSESQLNEIINNSIIDLNASSIKDIGAVISEVNKKVLGRAEGRIIAEIVKKKLSN
ncbi:MAG: GatB/YqeY domain-containing protein [Bacteroidetes bacterium]|nr:GatB/YqeY domain-containing protein [Bacteroidota bacterium]MDA0885114.1 GatB/YqeY domain-containing protein [Bacteroidota bacterium]MDA1225719.1 GatB/YqeY domain-containing protein [Bacteroidota bacterium]